MDDFKSRKVQLRPEGAAGGPAKALLVLVYAGSLDAPDVGHRFELSGEELIIGRSSDAGIQIDRDSVSRRHARLSRQGDGWVVADLQSTNGSYINDMPIREHRLQSGELLKIGNAIFRFLAAPGLDAALADEQYRIAVSDAYGRVVRSLEISGTQYIFQRKGLPNGAYFFRVEDAKGQRVDAGILMLGGK